MKALKTAVCMILALLIFFCFAAGIAALSVSSFIADPVKLSDITVSGNYYELMRDEVGDAVQRSVMLLSLDESVFTENVADEEIDKTAYETLEVIYSRILKGSETELPRFGSEKLLAAVETELRAYAEENDLVYEEGSEEEVYEYLCGAVSQRMHVIGGRFIEKMTPYTRRLAVLDKWYLPLLVCAVFSAAIILIRKREIFLGIHTVLCALYAGSFFPFVLARIFAAKDYMKNIILSNYSLRELLLQLYRALFASLSLTFGIVFAIVAALLAADIFLLAKYGPSVNARRIRHPDRKKKLREHAEEKETEV